MTWNAMFPGRQVAKPLSFAASPLRQPAFAGRNSNRETPDVDRGGLSWERRRDSELDDDFFKTLNDQDLPLPSDDHFTPTAHSPRSTTSPKPTESVYPDLDDLGKPILLPYFHVPEVAASQKEDPVGFFSNPSVNNVPATRNPFEQSPKRAKVASGQSYVSQNAFFADVPPAGSLALFDNSFLGVQDASPSPRKRKAPSTSGHSPVETTRQAISASKGDVTRPALIEILNKHFKGKQNFHVTDLDPFIRAQGMSVSKTAQVARELSKANTLAGFRKLDKKVGRYSYLPPQ